MSESEDEMRERSTLNRLTSLQAAQEQQQKTLEQLHSSLKALTMLCVYSTGLALLVWLALRYPGKFGAKA